VVLGLVLLGFTSVDREGFEVVLFLRNLRVTYGSAQVLQGVAIGLALTAAVGWARRLPDRGGRAAQAAALVLVAGSYVAAERVRGSRASAQRPGRAVPES
jgi:high-affinity Fe2+/Pb2+ permease